MPISVHEIKSLQYVFIVKADLAVTEGPEKNIERLQVDVMEMTTDQNDDGTSNSSRRPYEQTNNVNDEQRSYGN